MNKIILIVSACFFSITSVSGQNLFSKEMSEETAFLIHGIEDIDSDVRMRIINEYSLDHDMSYIEIRDTVFSIISDKNNSEKQVPNYTHSINPERKDENELNKLPPLPIKIEKNDSTIRFTVPDNYITQSSRISKKNFDLIYEKYSKVYAMRLAALCLHDMSSSNSKAVELDSWPEDSIEYKFSKDDKFLLSSSLNNSEIKIWNIETGEVVHDSKLEFVYDESKEEFTSVIEKESIINFTTEGKLIMKFTAPSPWEVSEETAIVKGGCIDFFGTNEIWVHIEFGPEGELIMKADPSFYWLSSSLILGFLFMLFTLLNKFSFFRLKVFSLILKPPDEDVLNLIKKNKMKEAFNLQISRISPEDIEAKREIYLLASRFYRTQKDWDDGLLDRDKFDEAMNNIVQTFLNRVLVRKQV